MEGEDLTMRDLVRKATSEMRTWIRVAIQMAIRERLQVAAADIGVHWSGTSAGTVMRDRPTLGAVRLVNAMLDRKPIVQRPRSEFRAAPQILGAPFLSGARRGSAIHVELARAVEKLWGIDIPDVTFALAESERVWVLLWEKRLLPLLAEYPVGFAVPEREEVVYPDVTIGFGTAADLVCMFIPDLVKIEETRAVVIEVKTGYVGTWWKIESGAGAGAAATPTATMASPHLRTLWERVGMTGSATLFVPPIDSPAAQAMLQLATTVALWNMGSAFLTPLKVSGHLLYVPTDAQPAMIAGNLSPVLTNGVIEEITSRGFQLLERAEADMLNE